MIIGFSNAHFLLLVEFRLLPAVDISIYPHRGQCYEIFVCGLAILDTGGSLVYGDIMFNAPDDDRCFAAEFEKKYGVGTLHWVTSSAFYFDGRSLRFYPR